MDPVFLLIVLLPGAAAFLILELPWRMQLGTVVCSLVDPDERGQKIWAAVLFALGGVVICAALSVGDSFYPAIGVVLWELGLSFLIKARVGARLGEGGFQPIYGRVIR